jgi:hypothetical protein
VLFPLDIFFATAAIGAETCFPSGDTSFCANAVFSDMQLLYQAGVKSLLLVNFLCFLAASFVGGV